MSSNRTRTVGNVRTFIGNSLGGLRRGTNLASWCVAGTLAYFLWVKPSLELKKGLHQLQIIVVKLRNERQFMILRKLD